ncbi:MULTISPECIES: MFS transporter [Sphingobacterium]|uniref:MFS transport protein AraJ n=1 Tax=Sphingobacterium multivorum TaxID=28454 RepID=A0A2X2J0I1_SPHMU|nr:MULTISPECIES: MFS transporter [Sphingobacterium]HAU55490.1 MFS transporter [Sphingobacterium sp.]QQT61655.1 MFS transporter [Sphingobacterium multivorum]QRQ63539.1 MFS transporter [Sphingobacterium multivorum]SPZ85921.1 MFS transport protein AraJ [Sphingobacterium multivorum]VXD05410.1 MFS transporter [Sphingobacterium multivorum]
MKKSLSALALGGLGIGITEFSMMGMLPDVAQSLQVSIPEAGYLITAYALGVVIGAPLLVVAMNRLSPLKTLITLMGLFTLFNGLSVIAPDYGLLLVSRFISGLPHGAFFGVGSVIASRLADPGKEAQAVATMYSGLTVANLFGVPLGTYIGHHFSWRYTFLLIVVVGILTMLALKLWMPKMKAAPKNNPWKDFGIFRNVNVWFMVLLFSVAPGALFAWISYIAPLMTEVSGIADKYLPYIMVLAGLGMFVGNLIGGKLTDTFSPTKVVVAVLVVQILCMLAIYGLSDNVGISLVMTFLTGVTTFALVPSLTLLLLNSVKSDAEMLVASLGPACFNIANALGAFLGGVPINQGYGYTSPALVGAVMAALGIVISLCYIQRSKKQPTMDNKEVLEDAVGQLS